VEALAEIDRTQDEMPPTVRARGALRTSMRFLDNASSNWEWLLCPWQVSAEYLYARESQDLLADNEPAQIMAINSRQHAIVHFTPACLLTIGDVLAYASALLAQGDKPDLRAVNANGAGTSGFIPSQRRPRPEMKEQMGISIPLTERLPQRYCIQNHLGVNAWYWTPENLPHASMSKHELPAGASQQMRCKPKLQHVTMELPDGGQVCAICMRSFVNEDTRERHRTAGSDLNRLH
jgi:hypothetical protein